MLVQNNIYCWIETTIWIEIVKSPDANTILFDIIAITPRETLGLCCVYIAQLMSHPAIYTLPFTLQLCYKPLGIVNRATKSQKVHISSYDGFYTRTKKSYFSIFVCFWYCTMVAS